MVEEGGRLGGREVEERGWEEGEVREGEGR